MPSVPCVWIGNTGTSVYIFAPCFDSWSNKGLLPHRQAHTTQSVSICKQRNGTAKALSSYILKINCDTKSRPPPRARRANTDEASQRKKQSCAKGSIIKCLFLSLSPPPLVHQYGFVNYALELLVLKNFGLEIWEQIKWVIKKGNDSRSALREGEREL